MQHFLADWLADWKTARVATQTSSSTTRERPTGRLHLLTARGGQAASIRSTFVIVSARVDALELLKALSSVRPHARARNVDDDAALAETVRRLRQRLDAVFLERLPPVSSRCLRVREPR